MPLLYITSKINIDALSKSIDALCQEIINQPDFKNSRTTIKYNKKTLTITILTENEARLNSIIDAFKKLKIRDSFCCGLLNFKEDYSIWGKRIKKEIRIHEGINTQQYKKIKSILREYKLWVNISEMNGFIRIQSKRLDYVQLVTVVLQARRADIEIPLQVRYL